MNGLVTDSHIFLPVYGQENHAVVQSLIEAHTDKIVVPINAEDICFMGGSVRCLTWDLKDHAADTIIQAANPYPLGIQLASMSSNGQDSAWWWGGAVAMTLLVGGAVASRRVKKR